MGPLRGVFQLVAVAIKHYHGKEQYCTWFYFKAKKKLPKLPIFEVNSPNGPQNGMQIGQDSPHENVKKRKPKLILDYLLFQRKNEKEEDKCRILYRRRSRSKCSS